MPRGTVKWFNDDEGFGFIVPRDGSQEAFVHCSEIQSEYYPTLHEGDEVEYELSVGMRGPRAANVRPAGEVNMPNLRSLGPSPSAGVRSFRGESLRQLEWEINEWAEAEKTEMLSVTVVPRGTESVGALVAYRSRTL
jgi:CspA family cold shock protein